MALTLYLDDCAFSKDLVRRLQAAGHQVTVPADAGLTGRPDHLHFRFAAAHGCILVTKNPQDFIALHNRQPTHPGIFLIYEDNDPTRDMNNEEIVQAIDNLVKTFAESIPNNHHNLNHWRPPGARPSASAGSPPGEALPPSPAKGPKQSQGRPRKPKRR